MTNWNTEICLSLFIDAETGQLVESGGEEADRKRRESRFVVNPDENFMFYWLAVNTAAVLYNLWTCIAREAFREIYIGWN